MTSTIPASLDALAERHARPLRGLRDGPRDGLRDGRQVGRRDKACTTGTHRVRPLAETVELARACLPAAGVSRVADVTGLDCLGIPVVNTIRPDAEPHNLTVTCGKGVTREAAVASAMMEAVERHCGEQGGRAGAPGTMAEVAALSEDATPLHPTRLVLARDHEWTPDTPLEWWPTLNLADERLVLVPAAAVFTPYKKPPRLIGGYSDGLAAGNSPTEAVVHALYELVERDCTAFGETLLDGVRLDLDSLDEPAAGLADRLVRSGVELHLFMFTNDIGVPTAYAVIDDTVRRLPWLVCAGAGCHLDPAVAVCRAITEAVQSRLSIISGGREDLARLTANRRGSYEAVRELLTPWLRMPGGVRLAEFPNQSTGSLSDDLTVLMGHLRRVGLGVVLATELNRFPMPFSVVRVIVPGLEFFHEERDRMGARLFARLMSKRSTV
ncbi:YcaO-like family protein [Actinophytocola sp.]|uniref:YcaO-like family protein n=1 Tax=Actinophytocola sp. TaxID=1872138 RepID=UPI003D6B1B10